MQPLIYKQRIHRWGFRKSFFVSLGFHVFILFSISFAVIQQPWKFQEETIVNIKFANSAFDMAGQSLGADSPSKQNTKPGALVTQDVTLQTDSQFSVRRLESNSTLNSFEAVYLNAWQRKIEMAGYYEIASSNLAKGQFRVQIKSVIDAQGTLLSAEILESSGDQLLDKMALRILRKSSPFQPFSAEMLSRYEQLEIIRDWNFTNS
ncbi:TonB family protein [Gammaproteobacteria bacterium]|nr:TonB family protein [Gammaproteobacteria bacterium]